MQHVAHACLNLLNKLRKSNNIRGLLSILLLFHNKFNKINNTGARILDSIYQMALKLTKITFLASKSHSLIMLHSIRVYIVKVKKIFRQKKTIFFENYNQTHLDMYNGLSKVYCIKPEGRIQISIQRVKY